MKSISVCCDYFIWAQGFGSCWIIWNMAWHGMEWVITGWMDEMMTASMHETVVPKNLLTANLITIINSMNSPQPSK